MRRIDEHVRGLTERLCALAESIPGAKAPTPRSVLVWIDTLEECDPVDVWSALADWPKTNIRAPAPAEILRVAREKATARRENEARERLKQDRGAELVLEPPDRVGSMSPEAREAFDTIRKMIAGGGLRLFKTIPDGRAAVADSAGDGQTTQKG